MRRALIFTIFLLAGNAFCGPFLSSPNSDAHKKRIPDRDSTTYWGMNLGPKGVLFSEEINALVPDHFGAHLEFEFSGMSNKVTFYWSPATVRAENDFLIGSDTIPKSRRINSQQWGILFGKRLVLDRRNEVGVSGGIEWGVIHSVQQDPHFFSPIIPGFALGADYYFALVEVLQMEIGLKSAYKYSTPDYRVYNRALGYGTHNFSINLSFREVKTKK
jgi:hypothetical protein